MLVHISALYPPQTVCYSVRYNFKKTQNKTPNAYVLHQTNRVLLHYTHPSLQQILGAGTTTTLRIVRAHTEADRRRLVAVPVAVAPRAYLQAWQRLAHSADLPAGTHLKLSSAHNPPSPPTCLVGLFARYAPVV